MNQIATIPVPRCPTSIRAATMDDLSFIDSLQKMHNKMVGFMPTKTLEGKIKAGHVIVAEEVASGQLPVASEESPLTTNNWQLTTPTKVGYCIGNDRYFKHDNVGVIYQLNVSPTKQRGLIGAALVKAMFDRAAYGCTLFCLWCAQDIEANRFWESLGFIPLAFRAGSRAKDRVHIFWEKRIRAGDCVTPWWFPTETSGGSMGENRLVFPIPPGVHWSDAMPRVLPGEDNKRLTGSTRTPKPEPRNLKAGAFSISRSKFYFAPPKPLKAVKEKPKRVKLKNDPALLAKARELNSRWLEEINSPGGATALPAPGGKYAVCKTSASSVEPQIEMTHAKPMPLLTAA